MATTVLLGLGLGVALGALMTHGKVCFNSGVRRAAFDRDGRVLRVFAVAVAVQMILLPALVGLGLDASPLPLLPAAQVAGGLVFGAGMALAGGCIAGSLWKTGAGSLAAAIALVGFAAGELLMLGPGRGLLRSLEAVGRPDAQTLHELVGARYAPLAVALGALVLAVLLTSSRAGAGFGLALGALGAVGWVIGAAVGFGYGVGFGGTADNMRDAIAAGRPGAVPLPFFVAVGVVVGAAAVTRGPVRQPDAARAGRALGGGMLMGGGAAIAHGCNIGHVLTGVPLLSLASMLAAVAMAAGVVLTWRVVLAPRPVLRGIERPEPVGW